MFPTWSAQKLIIYPHIALPCLSPFSHPRFQGIFFLNYLSNSPFAINVRATPPDFFKCPIDKFEGIKSFKARRLILASSTFFKRMKTPCVGELWDWPRSKRDVTSGVGFCCAWKAQPTSRKRQMWLISSSFLSIQHVPSVLSYTCSILFFILFLQILFLFRQLLSVSR